MRLRIALAAALLVSPAFGEGARKIDFTQVLKDQRGVDILAPDPDKGKDATKPFTLGAAVSQALLFEAPTPPGASQAPYSDKVRRALLAIRIEGAKDAELTTEEITKIKEVTGEVYTPIVVLRIVEAIDPTATK